MYIKFEWLKFKNIRSYSNTETKVDFNNGMTLITGTNGVGKSSMIEALTYNLYGKPYTKIKINELINRYNKKGLYTESLFRVGKDIYNIIRGSKPNKLEIKKNGEILELLSSKSLSQDDIDKILGINYKMFKNVISLSASNKPFLDKDTTKAERREIIETIFNINIFADMLKILKKDISILKTDIGIEESNIKLMEENISSKKKDIADIEESKNNFENNKKKDVTDIQNEINKYKESIKENKFEIENKKSEIDKKKIEDEKNIQLLEEKMLSEDKRINQEIEKYNFEFSEIIKNKEKILSSNKEMLVKSNIEIDSIKSEIASIEEKYKIKNDKLMKDYDRLISELNEKLKEYKNIDSELRDYKNEKQANDVNIKFLSNKIDDCKNMIVFYEENNVCSQCQHEISDKEKTEFIDKTTAEIEKYKLEINDNKNNISEINKKIHNIEEKLKEKTAIKEKLFKADDIKDNQILKLRSEKRDLIDSENEKLNKMNIKSIEVEISNIEESIKSKKESYNKDAESIKNSSKVLTYKAELESIKNNEFESSMNNQISMIEKNIISLEESIKNSKGKIQEIEKRIFTIDLDSIKKEFDGVCNKYKLKYKKYKKDADSLLVKNLTKDVLSDGGIKTYFFKKLIPILNQKINIYLDKFNIPISLVFDEEMNSKISSLAGRDEDINYNSFSGGERKRIDMSILFSFIDLMKVITNWNCNILNLDEILDSGIDYAGLIELLENLKEMINKTTDLGVYVVSHKVNDEQYNMFDSIWHIEKVNQFSKLEIK